MSDELEAVETMETMDISPTPRVLWMLGEIPFQPWQCIAELIDNSIDAFLSNPSCESEGERKISVSWTGDSVAAVDRTVEVTDNACGMTLEQLQNAVRAGYSSNDPIGSLGLFGMGFNISTARLGELTTILTTRKGDSEWVGVRIDIPKLISAKGFVAPIIRMPKENPNISGTKIKISRLRPGILIELPAKEAQIRQRLEIVYSQLLNTKEIVIYVKGKQLKPYNHCVWSESRYVIYNGQVVPARIYIDRDLGDALFDLNRNCYLSADEAETYYIAQQEGKPLPPHIVERRKRLTGWLGIQRYADPNDFGIDFIRNGRKILISDKSLFQYENPITGQKEVQYPLELGNTVGGRIVGELHVDYLLPTYQKNDFDRTDNSWAQTVEAICGVGPFRRETRKALGFTEPNNSPLGLLVGAYMRPDPGTRRLFVPNAISKRFALEFRKGTPEYLDDSLWWKVAQEEDQKASTGGSRSTTTVNTGNSPSDDVESYLGSLDGGSSTNTHPTTFEPEPPLITPTTASHETSTLDELINRSKIVNQLSGRHYRFGNTAPFNVRVYELGKGDIFERGEKVPCICFYDGIECDFVYNPAHTLLSQYPITPKMLLLIYLSERLKARDQLTNLVAIYAGLVESTMPEAKLDRQSLQDRANSVFELLREKLGNALREHAKEVVDCIHESAGEVEETLTNLIQANPSLIMAFQMKAADAFDVIDFVPPKTLYRLIERFPENIFDGKVFSTPYLSIALPDVNATHRAREEAKDRVLSFVKDALRVISGYSQRAQKNELARASISVDFLLKELGE